MLILTGCTKPAVEAAPPGAETATAPTETSGSAPDSETEPGGWGTADGDGLAVPTDRAFSLYRADGTLYAEHELAKLVPSFCSTSDCFLEGGSQDGDLYLHTWVYGNLTFEGGVIGFGSDGAPTFTTTGHAFPHDVVRDPNEGSIIVCEALRGIRWIAGDGSSNVALRWLDDAHPDWPTNTPNSLDLVTYEGRTLILVSYKGSPLFGVRTGALALWDITDLDAITLVWRFPDDGYLDTPHGAALRPYEGGWILVYAHTRGGDLGGTVGVAVTDRPDAPPAYVADLVPSGGPYEFLRGVEPVDGGALIVTDAGEEYAHVQADGSVMIVGAPDLSPAGVSGAVDGSQRFVEVVATPLIRDLATPFEARASTLPPKVTAPSP